MNILFFSLLDFDSFSSSNIYTDLLTSFIEKGNVVYAISPVEKKKNKKTSVISCGTSCILKPKIFDYQKVSFVKKGISAISLSFLVNKAIERHFKKIDFDLILYTTPPITIVPLIRKLKRKTKAKTFLLLKDIFPQNAVDLGIVKKTSPLYFYFRNEEKGLYKLSDGVGCMSQKNIDYFLLNNKFVDKKNIMLCPNSIIPIDKRILLQKEKDLIRSRYGLPLNKKIFVYGGNLGKPQGISFLLDCLPLLTKIEGIYLLIIGDGTEFNRISLFLKNNVIRNVKLIHQLPNDEYIKVIASCDVGLIFLDYRFTIPNYPSRLLSYLQVGIPVLSATDKTTDINKAIIDGKFGWSCFSNNPKEFIREINSIRYMDLRPYGDNGFKYLKNEFSVEIVCSRIMQWFNSNEK
jgi:glycosyltransferase involved in cell wall biosynthesis